jgi:hypothetical protein
MKIFVKLTNALGYGSPKQMAGRRAFGFYEQVCAVKPDHDREFWQQGELSQFWPLHQLLTVRVRMSLATNFPILVHGD